jgi:glutamate carboxypeptidase
VALEGTGASDAAIAALESRAAVMEGFGPLEFGFHSNNADYIFLSSIEPRLYLLSRMIIDVASGKASVP